MTDSKISTTNETTMSRKGFLARDIPNEQMLRNAIWGASLLTAAGLLFVIVGFAIAEINSWKDYILLGAPAMLFVLGVVSIALLRRGKVVLGTGLIFVANLIMPLIENLLQRDIGLVIFFYVLVSSGLLIWRTLPKASRLWASILAGAALLFIIGVEAVNSPIRVNPADELVAFIFGATVILAVAFIAGAVRQTWGRSLRNKLLIVFLGVTVIATGALSGYIIVTTRNNLYDSLKRELTGVATDRAVRIGNLLNEQIKTLTVLSLNQTLQQETKKQNRYYAGDAAAIQAELNAKDAQWRAADAAGNNSDPLVYDRLNNIISLELLEYRNTFPDNVEVFITDIHGGVVATTNRTSDYNQADEDWWQAAYNNGLGALYISSPLLDESSGKIGTQVALPLRDRYTGAIIGILRTTYILAPLDAILQQSVGQTGTADMYIPGRTITRIHQGMIEPVEPQVFEQLQAVAGQGMVEMDYDGSFSVVTQSPIKSGDGNPVFNKLGWILVFHQDRPESFASVNTTIQGITIVVVTVILFTVAAAIFLAQFLVSPLTQLTHTAQEIAAGNFNSQAQVTSSDEIGLLASTFNEMTAKLREAFGTLEQRVAERTAKMERRNLDLALAAEVGQSVSQVRALNEMLSDAAEIIRAFFGLYYVQVYLANENQTELVLQFGTGEVGADLMQRKHHLPLNSDSLNGRAAVTKRSVVISDTANSDIFRPNPLLPNTRSEVAVPLLVGNTLVGVLDVQSEKAGLLDEEALLAFEPMAGQMAVAIQNARLVAETQEARAEVETLVRRLTHAGWEEYFDAIHKPESTGFVFQQNNVAPLTGQETPAEDALVAPIQVTGESLGNLVVELQGTSPISRTDELVNTVARQVSQHIESLRLLESAERFRYEAEQASRRLTHEGWQEYKDTNAVKDAGYTYNLNEVVPSKQDEIAQMEESGISLPLKVRDEAIGKLIIQGVEAGDSEAIGIANAVAERLSAHIEGLRLAMQTEKALSTTKKQAQREQALRQITSAVRSSTDPAVILRTAARELGSILGRQTVVQLATAVTDSASPQDNESVSPAESSNADGGEK
jgi:GAF domain-containing protein